MNHIEKTKFLVEKGMHSFINPAYLNTLSEQSERSMLGQRTVFLKFHRYMYSLTDQQIYKIWNEYKEHFRNVSKGCPGDNFIDLSLLRDAIQFQISIRDDKQASPEISEEIAMSFSENVRLAKYFEEITSDHLIEICDGFLNK